ncbi:Immunoreactive 53 kDa antigen PG123 [Fulvivirga imtechensis AK7]|uniref:Immunoreactive 53 kDa antigen PG123 n=1 Tax=Fulvivirga imtechensis AK7 TaxID=1237149 RepID=L8JP78_9BACT|nr:OmpA family protein [Fulvivirga imtechensis]ELR70013.1 Immunoreactive 53 kDa antigen PG123 [Fulvivirga imtechensis AK7]
MRKLFYAIALFGVLSLSGCALNQMVKMAEDQNLTVTPNPLEVHADTVAFEMSANLPVKMLKKGKVYSINTFYKYGDNEIALEPVQFKADDYPNAGDQQPKQTKEYAFAYSPAMNNGMLEVQGVASDPKNGKSKETERMAVAPGVITTSKLVEPVYFAAYADHGYNNQEELVPTRVNFYFDQGRSELKYSERRSNRGSKLSAYIAEKNATRTVTITGTHSPEGAERINARLAKDRAVAIQTFYTREMKKYDYKGLADSIKFITKDVVEDWSVFKDSLAVYEGISSEEKSAYLDIINGPGSYEDKEDKLHKLPTYTKVFRELYPKLRVAKTEILTVKEKKTDAEISVLAKQIANESAPADTLSEEELLYAATLTPSLQEKEAIYKAATKNTSWVAHNNLGAVYVEMAKEGDKEKYMDMAATQFEIAMNKKETAEVHANMATVELMKGNAYKAYSHIQKANSMSPGNELSQGINGVKGSAEIMMAKYDDAVKSTANAENTAENLFNKGLAQVLNKDYQNALTSFKEATEKDSNMAIAYYGAAIANAHLGKESDVYSSIEKAVQANPELKEKVLNDLEFATYVSNEQFRNILK